MSKETSKALKEIVTDVDDRGYIRARESTVLEFKESFGFNSMGKYLRTIASFANNKGGCILFGVGDAPRKPVGIKRKKFDEIKQETVSTWLSEYFSPQIGWDIDTFKACGKHYGYFQISEAKDKPVICKKNSGKHLKEGVVYYRYRGQSESIKFPELKKIHLDIRDRERTLWMSHVEQIARIGVENVALVDLFDGKLSSDNLPRQYLIEEHLLEGLKSEVSFIKEGEFSEKDGAPAIQLVGDLKACSDVVQSSLDPNKDYPYLQKHLAQELQLRPYDVQVLIWHFKLKQDRRYSIEVAVSDSGSVFKFSEYALRLLKEEIAKQHEVIRFLKALSKKYTSRA